MIEKEIREYSLKNDKKLICEIKIEDLSYLGPNMDKESKCAIMN